MQIDPYEEKKKDEVLQILNDILDANQWGEGAQEMRIKIEFRGKYDIERIFVDKENLRFTSHSVEFFKK